MKPQVIIIVGPTAAGKTAAGLVLAERLGAEIVNADSMQLYAGMDIGTAKTQPAERRGIPHHLLDIWSPTEEASVAAYQQLAREVIDDVLDRHRSAVVIGGSGLYIRALIDDLAFPGTDPALRASLAAEVVEHGAPTLHRRLAQLDPEAARAILPTNDRRIVRALEVIELTGRPFTATMPAYGTARWNARQLGIDPPVDELDARIADRVEAMWAAGLAAETDRLSAYPGFGPTAARALGYSQVLAWRRGELTAAQARQQTVAATRRFARRQRSWFRRDPRIDWFATGLELVAQGSPE